MVINQKNLWFRLSPWKAINLFKWNSTKERKSNCVSMDFSTIGEIRK